LHADVAHCRLRPFTHDHASFRALVAQALPSSSAAAREAFLERVSYVQADESVPAIVFTSRPASCRLDRLETPAPFNRSLPSHTRPFSQPIIARLAEAGLLEEPDHELAWRHLLLRETRSDQY
jgi:hypothetical protein